MSKWIRLYSDEDFTTGAGLPASGTILGARHYNTTDSTWYSWNGSAWEAEGGGGTGTVDTFGTPVATDYARFTDADTIEGRSPAEVRADLDLEVGTDVAAFSHTHAAADVTSGEFPTARIADNAITLAKLEDGSGPGQVLGYGAAGAPARIAAGAANQVLTSSGGLGPATFQYINASLSVDDDSVTLGKMAPKGDTDSGVLIYDATGNPATLGPGTAGQVLKSNGTGVAPSFATILISDTFANIPLASTAPNALFYATNTGRLYYSDGSTWEGVNLPAMTLSQLDSSVVDANIPGTATGDLVGVVDVGGSPGLPALDATNLTNVVASKIKTSGTAVTISTTPPTGADQYLKTTSATAAAWADIPTGGGLPTVTMLEDTVTETWAASGQHTLPGLTTTPAAGTYVINVSYSLDAAAASVAFLCYINVGGVAQTASLRQLTTTGASQQLVVHQMLKVALNGSQEITCSTGGPGATSRNVYARQMTIQQVAA